MPAARCGVKGFAFKAAHLAEFDDAVAGRVDDLQSVADLEFVLHVDLGHAVGATDDIADVLLAAVFRMASQVVLLFVGVVAFVETVGVTAARPRVERA